jgi:UDP-glucose 6-dehydrogenase
MNVFILGIGYVDLVSSACLAELGHNFVYTGMDSFKIENLQAEKWTYFSVGPAAPSNAILHHMLDSF